MSTKFAPFNTARQAALELSLQSKAAYIRWHKEHNPSYLPRYPDKVYDEFVSWNDWLGTNNTFKVSKKKELRPYWEAVKWSQHNAAENDINTGAEWVAWCRNNKDKLPKDIPASPEAAYSEFKGNGWSVWLGQDVRAKLKAHGVPTHIFAICSHENLSVPGNYYKIVHAQQGHAEMVEKLSEHRDMRVYRAYKWDDALREEVTKLIDSHSKDMGEGKMFIPALNALIFELDMLLEWVQIKKVATRVEIIDPNYQVPFDNDMMYIKRV